MTNSIKKHFAYLSLMAFLFCFSATVVAQDSKRVIVDETVKEVRTDVCLKGDAHKYKAAKGKRVIFKQRVKPAGTKRYVCATGNQAALKAERAAKKRAVTQKRKAKLRPQKKSVQAKAAKQ